MEETDHKDPSRLAQNQELRLIKKPTKLGRTVERVPKPRDGLPTNPLPLWRMLSLEDKVPAPPAPEGTFTFARTDLSQSLFLNTKDQEFDTKDPYLNETPNEYDSLHDPYLKNYFQTHPCAVKQLIDMGLITENGEVICTIGDLNKYRKYLSRVHKTQITSERGREFQLYENEKGQVKRIKKWVLKQTLDSRAEDSRMRKSAVKLTNERKLLLIRRKQDEHPSNWIHEQRAERNLILRRKRELRRRQVTARLASIKKGQLRRTRMILLHIICEEDFSQRLRDYIDLQKRMNYCNDLQNFIENKRKYQTDKLRYHRALLRRDAMERDCKIERREAYYCRREVQDKENVKKRRKMEKQKKDRIFYLMSKYGRRWLQYTLRSHQDRFHESTWHVRNLLRESRKYVKDMSGSQSFSSVLKTILFGADDRDNLKECAPETREAVKNVLDTIVDCSYNEFIQRVTSCLVDFAINQARLKCVERICGEGLDPNDLKEPIIPKRLRNQIKLPPPSRPCIGPCAELSGWKARCAKMVAELQGLHDELSGRLASKLRKDVKRDGRVGRNMGDLRKSVRQAQTSKDMQAAAETVAGIVFDRTSSQPADGQMQEDFADYAVERLHSSVNRLKGKKSKQHGPKKIQGGTTSTVTGNLSDTADQLGTEAICISCQTLAKEGKGAVEGKAKAKPGSEIQSGRLESNLSDAGDRLGKESVAASLAALEQGDEDGEEEGLDEMEEADQSDEEYEDILDDEEAIAALDDLDKTESKMTANEISEREEAKANLEAGRLDGDKVGLQGMPGSEMDIDEDEGANLVGALEESDEEEGLEDKMTKEEIAAAEMAGKGKGENAQLGSNIKKEAGEEERIAKQKAADENLKSGSRLGDGLMGEESVEGRRPSQIKAAAEEDAIKKEAAEEGSVEDEAAAKGKRTAEEEAASGKITAEEEAAESMRTAEEEAASGKITAKEEAAESMRTAEEEALDAKRTAEEEAAAGMRTAEEEAKRTAEEEAAESRAAAENEDAEGRRTSEEEAAEMRRIAEEAAGGKLTAEPEMSLEEAAAKEEAAEKERAAKEEAAEKERAGATEGIDDGTGQMQEGLGSSKGRRASDLGGKGAAEGEGGEEGKSADEEAAKAKRIKEEADAEAARLAKEKGTSDLRAQVSGVESGFVNDAICRACQNMGLDLEENAQIKSTGSLTDRLANDLVQSGICASCAKTQEFSTSEVEVGGRLSVLASGLVSDAICKSCNEAFGEDKKDKSKDSGVDRIENELVNSGICTTCPVELPDIKSIPTERIPTDSSSGIEIGGRVSGVASKLVTTAICSSCKNREWQEINEFSATTAKQGEGKRTIGSDIGESGSSPKGGQVKSVPSKMVEDAFYKAGESKSPSTFQIPYNENPLASPSGLEILVEPQTFESERDLPQPRVSDFNRMIYPIEESKASFADTKFHPLTSSYQELGKHQLHQDRTNYQSIQSIAVFGEQPPIPDFAGAVQPVPNVPVRREQPPISDFGGAVQPVPTVPVRQTPQTDGTIQREPQGPSTDSTQSAPCPTNAVFPPEARNAVRAQLENIRAEIDRLTRVLRDQGIAVEEPEDQPPGPTG